MTFESEYMTRADDGTVFVKFSHPLALGQPDAVRSISWDEFEQSLFVKVAGTPRRIPPAVFTWLYDTGYRPTELFGGDLYVEPAPTA